MTSGAGLRLAAAALGLPPRGLRIDASKRSRTAAAVRRPPRGPRFGPLETQARVAVSGAGEPVTPRGKGRCEGAKGWRPAVARGNVPIVPSREWPSAAFTPQLYWWGGGETPTTTSTSSIRQLLGAADTQTAHPATSSTAPVHQRLGSANAETTPAGAPAAAADRTQRPGATGEGKSG